MVAPASYTLLTLNAGPRELSEHRLYLALLGMSPGLEERLNTVSEQDIHYVADMVGRIKRLIHADLESLMCVEITKGVSSARSDDTKSLKSAMVDWITPQNQLLNPPIQQNVKTDRGFHHARTGELLCPVSLDWSDDK